MNALSAAVVSDTLVMTVNGERQVVACGTTVATLLETRGLVGKRVAVERNGAIVPRSVHATTGFSPGDRVEIVVAVGGG
jgi:sulfur carrier protein